MNINQKWCHVPCDGTYPQRCSRLLELIPPQVMAVIEEWGMVRDPDDNPIYEGFSFQNVQDHMWINKGYVEIPSNRALAIYHHDERWWLIQKFNAEEGWG